MEGKLFNPNYYKQELKKRQEIEADRSKDRVLKFITKIHESLMSITSLVLPLYLSFPHCSGNDKVYIYPKDIELLLIEVQKRGWVIDPESIKWHSNEFEDDISSLNITPILESHE